MSGIPGQPSKTLRPPYRVVIVDDHPLVLWGLTSLLQKAGNFEICAHAENPEQAMALIGKFQPDISILDLSLKGKIAIDLIKDLRHMFPTLKILVLSVYLEPSMVKQAIQVGASGYFSKEDPTDLILEALAHLCHGIPYLSPAIAKRIGKIEPSGNERLGIEKLSAREFQIFKAIGEGVSLKEIAHEAGLSPKTVETYCQKIKNKFHLRDGRELSRFATLWYWKSQGSGIS
ncbi:response regulator transcription factor [Deltaproteobacteria bacterium PRO3]|nr:response regulator transcription factor [Deltaproteobacteria bacterium PRO3]